MQCSATSPPHLTSIKLILISPAAPAACSEAHELTKVCNWSKVLWGEKSKNYESDYLLVLRLVLERKEIHFVTACWAWNS